MGLRQQIRDRQMMGATGKAIPTGLTPFSIDLFPPVASAPNQVVALFCELLEVMGEPQVAQSQQLRNGHLLRTGEAGSALMAKRFTEPLLTQPFQTVQSGLFCRGKCPIAACHGGGKIEIARAAGTNREGANPSGQQVAVSKS
jgi:hypothetical protein